MNTAYHEGELAMQARAGTLDESRRMARGIQTSMPPNMRRYIGTLHMAVAASLDAEGHVWASLLTGEPGFLSTQDAQALLVNAVPRPGDPLTENLRGNRTVGLLLPDLAARRRMRVNGLAERQADGSILVRTAEVFGNCPQYIQSREPEGGFASAQHAGPRVSAGASLTESQQQWISRSDTFFIASAAPGGGADASHRGGLPGFVRVVDSTTLEWPDYSGNGMFQTLGNLLSNPHAGLLFLDFESGTTLQLTGQAQVIEDPARNTRFPGAQRVVEFHLRKAIEITAPTTVRWRFLEYSPYNPR